MLFNNDLRLCVILALLVLPLVSLAQSGWKVVRLDHNLSFSFPSDYKRTDTLGQKNFLGRTAAGYLQAIKVPWPQAHITNETDLIEYYNAFQKSAVEQSHGDLVSDSTIKLNDLYVRVFEFESFWNDTIEVQENMVILIDHSIYSFAYAYFKDQKEKARKERDEFFSNIITHDVAFEDQLTIPKSTSTERAGEFLDYIFRYVTIAALVLVIVLLFLKKYDQVRMIKNIFMMIFLTWGGVCLFLYVGNIFLKNRADSLLIMGGSCLLIGFVLRKIKVPLSKV